jgi:undecaprenyl-diphosphatase
MDVLQIIVLALVQGITEFLPVSSSAHLVLIPELTGWTDQGIGLDVAVHLGSLLAVLVYFRRDAAQMVKELAGPRKASTGEGGRLLLKVAIGAVPVLIAGALLRDFIESELRSALVIAWMTVAFAILLYLADRCRSAGSIVDMRLRDALFIGLAQVLALVPGVSRAGVTMTAARFLGYSRSEAARFSLLLSVPTILGASALVGRELYASGELALQREAWLAAGFAFLAALVSISAMMRWLRRASFTPFVVYRLLLGVGLLIWLMPAHSAAALETRPVTFGEARAASPAA